jgi:uncharacterized HAD superfamily protein/8-oxo-dGTP pyrophosphatase MutT (NUDIX family)
MNIGIDIDGVLVDTIRHSAEFLSARTGLAVSAHDIIHNYTGIADIDGWFERHGDELLGSLPPLAHAAEVLERLGGRHRLFLISARAECNRGVTVDWLARHGIRAEELILTGGRDKCGVCGERGIDLFIEDSPLNAQALSAAGIPVILLDTEYNRLAGGPGLRRCRDWLELEAAIAEKAATAPGTAEGLACSLDFDLEVRHVYPGGWRVTEPTRTAVRALVSEARGWLMVHSGVNGDWKFPGGGLEPGETHGQAVARELAEETGHRLGTVDRLRGRAIERWYDPDGGGLVFTMTSWYYDCRLDPGAGAGSLRLDGYEAALGFAPAWTSLEAAIEQNRKLLDNRAADLPGWVERDTRVLERLAERKENGRC